MEIVGNGFLARHLAPLTEAHDEVVAFAAGPSSTRATDAAEFDREAAALYAWVRRCRADGRLLLYFSTASASMYGGADGPGREDGPVLPGSAFGRHKLAMEGVLKASAPRHLILRLGHAAGPGQRPHQLVPALVRQVLAGRVLIQRGACRDLIAVAHAVGLVERLLSAGVVNDVVNVASGTAVSVEEIVTHLEGRIGVRARREYVRAAGPQTPVSVDRLRRLLGGGEGVPPFPGDYYRTVLDACLTADSGSPVGVEPNPDRGGHRP
ncbi:NAD-dependent epimerase/dehydratase family protein [Streptomyces sp. NPDC087305]|uniref:NAD-dependent epimerase/dehydratase family protein n=1 Tax=Streptomyces sp. NPDC087305 TaxID=3365781 RepID=UPI0037FE4229